MDNSTLVDSESLAFGDAKKGEKLIGFERKKLSDISNLQERPKPMNPDVKKKSVTTITPKEYIDKLQKENAELMKVLVERNKLIELSVVELRKLRVNLQKVRLQNLQLAQANSQMLAELNSGKDRVRAVGKELLKVLQHGITCQNGLLKARKLEARERKKNVSASRKPSNEVASSCHDDLENDPNDDNQRKKIRKQSLGCPPVKPVHTDEEATKKRRCSMRQSARLKTQDASDDPVGTSSQILEDSSAKNDTNGNTASESFNLPDAANAVDATKKSDKTRRSRRQSSRFVKTLQSEGSEDSFVTEDPKFEVSSLHGNLIEMSGQTIPGLSVNEEDEGSPPNIGLKTEDSRRSSVGRPQRRAAEKVQSYKEVPLNIKMRRTQ